MKTLNQLDVGDTYFYWVNSLLFKEVFDFRIFTIKSKEILRSYTVVTTNYFTIHTIPKVDVSEFKSITLKFVRYYTTDLTLMKQFLSSLEIDVSEVLDQIYKYENARTSISM